MSIIYKHIYKTCRDNLITPCVDLFKSPSEKKIRVNNTSAAKSRIGKGNERSFGFHHFAHQSSPTLGLRCARMDILSLTHVFFSDGDLNKSTPFVKS